MRIETTVVVLGLLMMGSGACGRLDESGGSGESGDPGESCWSDETGETGESCDPDEVAWSQFEVEGAEVWARTPLAALPERASIVQFPSLFVLDDGDGPELCFHGSPDTYPPSCSGPLAEGLVMDEDWTESSGGKTWGRRAVTLHWPVVGDVAQVVEHEATSESHACGYSSEGYDFSVPPQCESIQTWMDREVIQAYARQHPDTIAGVWVAECPSQVVLQVSGDLDQVRADLADEEGELCLEPVQYSMNQLTAAQARVDELFQDPDVMILGSGRPKTNRVRVGLAVADLASARAVATRVDDPGIFFVTGSAVILE